MNHNQELELELIHQITHKNDLLDKIFFLKTEDFYFQETKKIFDFIFRRYAEKLETTFLTIKPMLSAEFYTALVNSEAFFVDAVNTAKSIKELSNKRKLQEILNDFSKNKITYEATTKQLLEELTEQTSELSFDLPSNNEAMSLSEAMELSSDEQLNERISLGFNGIDNLVNKVDLGSFVILAGRPSMGKSCFALNMAINLSKTVSVLFFSLEVSATQIARRAISNLGNIPSFKVRNNSQEQFVYCAKIEAKNIAKELKLKIKDSGGVNLAIIRNEIKLFNAQGGKVVIIDYIQLIKHIGKKNSSTADDITAITNELKSLAMEYKIVIIGLSQLSRAVEQRENKRPQLSDLRSSGSIEQDADVVMFVHRPEYFLAQVKPQNEKSEEYRLWQESINKVKNQAICIIAKARDGLIGDVNFMFDGDYQKFYEIKKEENYGSY